MSIERRDNRRIVVGPEHTVRFLVRGHAFHNVRITNLSVGGCFATVAGSNAGLFNQGTLLEHFSFEHSSLSHAPFLAKVAFALGGDGHPGSLPFMGLGIQFLGAPEDVEQGILAMVAQALGAS